MRYIFVSLLFFVLVTVSARAQELSIETASDHIDITVGFTGSQIEVFGDRRDADTDIAVFVIGPEKAMTVWERVQVLGAWVNRYFAHFRRQPSYYSYATSFDPQDYETYGQLMQENRIGVPALFEKADIRTSGVVEDIRKFIEALVIIKKSSGLYPEKPVEMKFLNNHFFRVDFRIPPSAPVGEYKVHSFLIKKGKLVEADIDIIKVEQVGINALVLKASRDYALLYAIFCIIIAAGAGWLVNVVRVRL